MIDPPTFSSERRNPVGWIILAAIGIPILVMTVMEYLSAAFAVDGKARHCDTQLRTAVQIARSTPQWKQGVWKGVNECVAETKGEVSKDRLAAMVQIAAAREQGRPLNKRGLEALAKSPLERRRAFYRVYAKEKMSRSEAEALVRALPDTAFVYRMAKVHALEKAGVGGVRDRLLGAARPWYAAVLAVVIIIGAFVLGIVGWVVYGAMRASGFWKPLGHPLAPVTKPLADRCALDASLYLILFVGSSFVALVGVALSGPASLVVQSTFISAGIVGISFLSLGGRRLSLVDLGLHGRRLWQHIAWGIGGTVANVPIFFGMVLLGGWLFKSFPPVEHPVTSGLSDAGLPGTLLILLGAVVFAPFIEEIWFRGKLLPAFSAITGRPVWGILISSLLFAALHPTGLPSYLALASVGAMGAMLTYQTKSLVPAMVLHAMHNTATLLLAKLMF